MIDGLRRSVYSSGVGPGLPFAHLNLRKNPFGELASEARAAVAVIDPPALRPGEIAQIIATEGRGKTTLLLVLAARYPQAGHARVEPDGSFAENVLDRSPVLLDEADRLPPARLRAACARIGTGVLATHHDLSRRAGRPLATLDLPALDEGRLDAIVRRRIEAARRGPGPVPVVTARSIRALLDRYRDDLRAIEGTLYDAFQTLEGPTHVDL